MTVSEQIPIQRYTGDGSTVAFTFPYQLFDLDDVSLILRDDEGALVTTVQDGSNTYDYAVTGVLDTNTNRYPSATVTFNTAPPADYSLGITRNSPLAQLLNLINGGGLNEDALEFALDKIVHMVQDLQEQASRANLQDPATLLHSSNMTFNRVAKVTGIPDAVEDTDAVPLRQLSALAAQGDLAFNGFTRGGTIVATDVDTVDLSAFAFTPGQNQLLIFVNGVLQIGNYTENDDFSITFDESLSPGDRVDTVILNTTELSVVQSEIYDLLFAMAGTENSETLSVPLPREVVLPAGAPFSRASARSAAAAEAVYEIQKNGVQVGTVTWAASATEATFSVASDVTFNIGDRIAIVGPSTADSTLTFPGISLRMRVE